MLYSQKHPAWEYLPAGKRGEGFRGPESSRSSGQLIFVPNMHRMDKPGGWQSPLR